jgi:hypothetical protein
MQSDATHAACPPRPPIPSARQPLGRVGIIEQRFDGAHLDQKRQKAAETCLDTFSLQGRKRRRRAQHGTMPIRGLKNAHWAYHDFFALILPGWI